MCWELGNVEAERSSHLSGTGVNQTDGVIFAVDGFDVVLNGVQQDDRLVVLAEEFVFRSAAFLGLAF